jgi:tetratricopeptide (TPR) repeat protein
MYNEKPKEGTAAGRAAMVSELLGDKAKALDALSGVSNLIPPGFEAYLSTEESDASLIKAYESSYDKAVDLVRKRQISPALEVLLELSQYPWDAGTSEQLANRVLAIWDMRRNQNDLATLNERLKEKARNAAYNFDKESEAVLKKMQENDRKQSKGGKEVDKSNSAFLPASGGAAPSATPAVDAVVGKMKLTEEYLRSLEARASIKLNESQIKDAESKARKDFAGFIRVLHEKQWHHQTKLAADFYRVLFGDGDLPVEVAQMAANSGEILQRVRGNAQVFEFKTQQRQYASATKILQDDFAQAPNHPVLCGTKRLEKLKVADYLNRLQKIQNLIEARDFGTLDELLQQLTKDVADFDPTKPRALVRAVKRESQMRLGMAKLAAQQGDLEKALAEFKSASEAWPDNPDLEAASETFFKTQDVLNKSTVEFDRAVREANYRHIFDKSLEYGAAVKGDAEREKQMKVALEKVKDAETALEKARLFEQNGDSFGAWETLELAARKWPEDSKLNQRRADLAMQASEFVSKISKAAKEESKGNHGVALAFYLNARADYPASTMANDSIKRLGDRLLGRSSVPGEAGAATVE